MQSQTELHLQTTPDEGPNQLKPTESNSYKGDSLKIDKHGQQSSYCSCHLHKHLLL